MQNSCIQLFYYNVPRFVEREVNLFRTKSNFFITILVALDSYESHGVYSRVVKLKRCSHKYEQFS